MNQKLKRIIFLTLFISAGSFVGIKLFFSNNQTGIYPYSESKDRLFITDVFNKDWYWLVSENARDFNLDFTLDTGFSSTIPEYANKIIIKSLRENGQTQAFVAYYILPGYIGKIMFLATGENARGKGYARILMLHAMSELKKMGAIDVELVTRQNNSRARALYESLGFVIKNTYKSSAGDFVNYRKSL